MSIILNALRKSEQERKALQPEPPAAITVIPIKPVSARKLSNPLLIFGVINILAFAYLLFKFGQPASTVTSPALSVTPPLAERHDEQVKPAAVVSTLPVMQSAEPSKAISDLWEERKKSQQNEALKTTASKPKLPVKKKELTVPMEIRSPVEAKTEEIVDVPLAMNTPLNIEKITQTPEGFPEKPAVQPNRHNAVPLLRELSSDFQAKVPLSTINVLAYAEQPNNRFVIIDMVKYKIGQRIKGTISLLDILPESVILNFEGQAFRLERP